MKAVVMAGGYATRLWPITRFRAKPLLPVGGEPIIQHILEPLLDIEEVDEVFVSTNQRFSDDFGGYLEEMGWSNEVSLAVESTRKEEEKPGTIGALQELRHDEGIDDDLLVIAGDNLVSFDLVDFIDFYMDGDGSVVAAYDIGSLDQAGGYGLVKLEGDRVVDFQEKPDEPESTMVAIACYLFTGETLDLIDEYLGDGNNPDAPGYFVEWLQERESVSAFTFDGAWFDIGTPESYLDAHRFLMDGDSIVEDDVDVSGADIGENNHIMSDSRVVDSEINNCILFPGVDIVDCRVCDSIIDEEATIVDLGFSESVVGSDTEIYGLD